MLIELLEREKGKGEAIGDNTVSQYVGDYEIDNSLIDTSRSGSVDLKYTADTNEKYYVYVSADYAEDIYIERSGDGETIPVQDDCGSILNIGSVNSDKPLSRVFAYAASKAGVVNLTQNIAQEFATQGIRCNAICPGFFPAEQNRKILAAKRVENIMNGTPMRRYGDPSELIGAALLLLSRKAGSYITGSALYVDGGFTCSWF